MPAEDSSRAQLFHKQSSAQEKQTESYSIFLRCGQLSTLSRKPCK